MISRRLVFLPRWESFATTYGKRYFRFLAASVLGTAIYLAYLAYRNVNALTAKLTLFRRIRRLAPSVLFTSAVLEPVLWVSVVVFVVLAWRLIRGRNVDPRDRSWCWSWG